MFSTQQTLQSLLSKLKIICVMEFSAYHKYRDSSAEIVFLHPPSLCF